jgi:O-antigen/teichoic acid export membrane protein
MKKKQLVLNIGANFVSVMISLIISFFVTPYIVVNLGKEAYAFVPISNNFVLYMSILTLALTSMAGRFVTLKIHKNDLEGANRYYSTSFFANLSISMLWTAICVVIVMSLDKFLNIPVEIFEDVKLLFIFMFASFIVNLSTATFYLAAYTSNRLDINSMINIFGSFARITIIFGLFLFFKPKVYYIGVSVLAYMLILGSMNWISSKKLMPQLKISISYVNFSAVKDLLSSGIWNSFIQLSNVLLTGLDLVIANIILGPSAAGLLAVAKTAPMALQALISVVPNAFSPYLTILFAKESRDRFIKELLYTLKFTAILTGIPIAAYIALSDAFFKLWVPTTAGPELTMLSTLTMISSVAAFSIMPLFHIFTITNRLKWPSVAIFLTGSANILIVLALIRYTNFGLYAIAGVSSVLEIFRCLIFVPLYSSRCINIKPSLIYRPIIKALIFMFLLVCASLGIVFLIPANSWMFILLDGSCMVVVGVLIGIGFMVNREEREKLIAPILHYLKIS